MRKPIQQAAEQANVLMQEHVPLPTGDTVFVASFRTPNHATMAETYFHLGR